MAYLINNNININEEIKKELKEISNLSLIIKKDDAFKNYKILDEKLDSKPLTKKAKI